MAHKIVSGIYALRNTTTGDCYVGSSTSIYRRWYEHTKKLTDQCHCNPYLQAAWNKYSKEAFVLEVVEETSSDLLLREAAAITSLQPAYNLAKEITGGRIGRRRTQEEKDRIRASRLGKTHGPEARARMSASAQARGMSASLKEAQKRAVAGRARSAETRAKIAAGKRGKKPTEAHRQAVSEGLRRWHQEQGSK